MRSAFGSVRLLPSGRWQARYRRNGRAATAPDTFPTWADARAWLDLVAHPELRVHKGCPSCICRWSH